MDLLFEHEPYGRLSSKPSQMKFIIMTTFLLLCEILKCTYILAVLAY